MKTFSYEFECKSCGKKGTSNSPKSVWCSRSCRDKWYYKNSEKLRNRVKTYQKKRYNQLKDLPEFKKENYERLKRWLSVPENRKHFNRVMLERHHKRRAELNLGGKK